MYSTHVPNKHVHKIDVSISHTISTRVEIYVKCFFWKRDWFDVKTHTALALNNILYLTIKCAFYINLLNIFKHEIWCFLDSMWIIFYTLSFQHWIVLGIGAIVWPTIRYWTRALTKACYDQWLFPIIILVLYFQPKSAILKDMYDQ